MFRQDEIFAGGWREKTIDAMRRRRYDSMLAQLQPIEEARLNVLDAPEMIRRIGASWQSIEIKPMRNQQHAEIVRCVKESAVMHADCLSAQEHDLVERALILGGRVAIEDSEELDAAQALSLRLWGCVGLWEHRPCLELDAYLIETIAKAMAREEHEEYRRRFQVFSEQLHAMLYQGGAVDDRMPQQMIVRDVLCGVSSENAGMLARRYLWAGCDCVDYHGGVMLLHPALADHNLLIPSVRRKMNRFRPSFGPFCGALDILPQEVPLQDQLIREIQGAMRDGYRAEDTARSIRFLCKQGAPLSALTDVLQESLIVLATPSMRNALSQMYYTMPKWIECVQHDAIQ